MTQRKIFESPLFSSIKNYLEGSNDQIIYFFVPYIKTNVLARLIENLKNKIIIVTDLSPKNLLSQSSELELYPFCVKNRITLYTHENIHLKVYSINLESGIIASGNISNSGLFPNGNLEIGTLIEKFSSKDRLYLEKIRNTATFVDDEIYGQLKKWYNEQIIEKRKETKFEDVVTVSKKDHFLISALPMTKNVEDVVDGYEKINLGLEPSEDAEINACIYHDLANYNIDSGLLREEFLKKMKNQFFTHPFIRKIDEFINPEAYFGSIKEWIQKNCTDVPVPSRRELTENVQVLYDWFEKLGDGKYVVDIPGSHSQRIMNVKFSTSYEHSTITTKYENEVLRVLSMPGYTIKQIEEQYKKSGRKIHQNELELKNSSKSLWHYKKELDDKVKRNIATMESNDKIYPSGKSKFYHDIAHVIEKLNKQKWIVVWHNNGITGDGVWRLSEKGRDEIIKRELATL